MSPSRFVAAMLSVGLTVLDVAIVYCQDFPSKPIRILTSGAGGGSDFVSRQIAQGISAPLGQPVIVENRPSALLGELTAKAPPDGYTLLVTGASLWTLPLLRKAPYDAVKDFSPLSLVSREVNVVAVHPSLPVKTVKELVALAKARPGALNYSTGSKGSATHLAAELFMSMANVKIVSVPYKNQQEAITAVVSGEVQLVIIDQGVVMPQVKAGRLRALAVTSPEPSALVPGLPTVAASGLPGYEAVGVTGIWAPAKTPGAIVTRLNQEIVRSLKSPEVRERLLSTGSEPVGSSPEQFAAVIQSDIARMGKVIRDAGIKMD